MPDNPSQLLADISWLTGGNPFEIALVAQHLWLACKLGEQERFELTHRILERALPHIAMCTGAEDAFVDAALAMQDLDPDELTRALDLVALSELDSRQVAIARLLGVPNAENRVNNKLLTGDVETEEERVIEELEELDRRGVVTLDESGHFSVRGGRRAAVALKYHARSVLGPDVAEKPFGIPFLHCVGSPLAEDYARRVADSLPETRRLGGAEVLSSATGSASARLRAATDARPFSGLDLELFPFDAKTDDWMIEFLLDPNPRTMVLVDITVGSADRVLDLVEVWEIPTGVELHVVNQALSDALDEWQPLLAAAGVQWQGAHAVRFVGDAAREALIQLAPQAAEGALRTSWPRWLNGRRLDTPDTTRALLEVTVRALRGHRVPDWERGWELSRALSRLGFVLSFYDESLDNARQALEQAMQPGPGDSWVTKWNLAYLDARDGEFTNACGRLDEVERYMDESLSAHVLFFVPGRPAIQSVIALQQEAAHAVFALQYTLLAYMGGSASDEQLERMLTSCERAPSPGPEVSEWVRAAPVIGPAGAPVPAT